MILRSLLLAGWRSFAEPTLVGPFSEGLNVLHAPNGAGKSTLFEALRRGLLDAYTASGREHEALRPWGRSLAPTVTLELEAQGIPWRVRKRFLDKPLCELSRGEGGRYSPVDQGERADARIRAWFSASTPKRGAARPEHWGLLQVLWAPQGELALPDLAPETDASLRHQLASALAPPQRTAALLRLLEERYLGLYTPTTGKLRAGKGGAPAARLAAELEAAQAELERLRTQWNEERALREAVTLASARHTEALARESALAERLAKARAEHERSSSLRAEREARQGRVEVARARREELAQRWQQRQRILTEREQLEAQIGGGEPQRRALENAVAALQPERDAVARELASARARREEQRALAEQQRAARQWHELRARRDSLAERIEALEHARLALFEARREREALRAPDASTLRSLRAAAAERARAEATLAGLRTVLTLRALGAGARLSLQRSEGPAEPLALGPGEERTLASAEPLEVLVGDRCALRVEPPPELARGARESLSAARRRFESLAEPFGGGELETLEALTERAQRLSQREHEASAHYDALRDASATPAALAQLDAQLEKLRAAHPEWGPGPAAPAQELDESALRALEQEALALERKQRAVEDSFTEADRSLRALLARREERAQRLATLLERLFAERAEGTDDALATQKLEAQRALEEAERELAALEAPSRASEELPALEREAAAAATEARRALEDRRLREGRLEALGGWGTYVAMAAAAERVETLAGRHKQELGRAEAVRLLWQTVQREQESARVEFSAPLAEEVRALLGELQGSVKGAPQWGEGFAPSGWSPSEAAELRVGVDALSGGEREQLYLATRLALARLLSREERQLVVLDDVLVATDEKRMQRVLTVLEREAKALQVVVLTCHPERYRSLESARWLSLEEARVASHAASETAPAV